MRDHRRILGLLFIAWAILQAAASLFVGLGEGASEMVYPAVFWISTALMVAIYAWAGWRLRQRDPRVRFLAIVLSALTVLSFPIGTLLGAYGLWAMLHRPKAEAAP